ncbi:hypothetical protein [Anaerosacchariphilus polymeriproducens]|uniref:Uncharacterized protein n=1 Tax=Anaerosacchariphilus polymeriproducens TaxID=1812858 RepID=A0A371AYE3_9FIRM|nr:hypothetical protein [Anaerosacchariphilus polymeriproducens]RDU24500.1 hypothetical protein DWV06_03255 [Anaerosacchariphilus polymeriproducens]
MNTVKSLLPHMLIILSGIFIVFLILNSYNPTMNFVTNSISIKLFWVFCILSIMNAILNIISNRNSWRNKKL